MLLAANLSKKSSTAAKVLGVFSCVSISARRIQKKRKVKFLIFWILILFIIFYLVVCDIVPVFGELSFYCKLEIFIRF